MSESEFSNLRSDGGCLQKRLKTLFSSKGIHYAYYVCNELVYIKVTMLLGSNNNHISLFGHPGIWSAAGSVDVFMDFVFDSLVHTSKMVT